MRMTGRVSPASPQPPPPSSFEYELLEPDLDNVRTVVENPVHSTPLIDPSTLRLRHRIGRGPFGDVWLGTHHRSTKEYDEYHEVAIKILPSIEDEDMEILRDRLCDLFQKCHMLEGVCTLYGITIMNLKICLVMKFYEGSIGDKLSRQKGGRLALPDVLRYGIGLGEGLIKLHRKGILVLNLKPCSFLLNEDDGAIVGDVGIPHLLLGISYRDDTVVQRLGTPNYMAPEQWHPRDGGPLSFETDSWGFGCSVIEMLTGRPPWHGLSPDEIRHSVVVAREKPPVPPALPPELGSVLLGCFVYDLRDRPMMSDILQAFRSCRNDACREGTGQSKGNTLAGAGFGWLGTKDVLQVGDLVRSRKVLRPCAPEIQEGTVVGTEPGRNGSILVRVRGVHDPVRVNAASLERVTLGLAAGDWVRVKERDGCRHSTVGVLHSVDRGGAVTVGLVGLETLWKGVASELEMSEPFGAGRFVRLRIGLTSPRYEWPRRSCGEWATGRVCSVLPNGCLIVRFPGMLFLSGEGRRSFMADPAEVELVSFVTCPGLPDKYRHLEDFHWSVRPILVAVAAFLLVRLGVLAGDRLRSGRKSHQHNEEDRCSLRSRVTGFLFRDAASR